MTTNSNETPTPKVVAFDGDISAEAKPGGAIDSFVHIGAYLRAVREARAVSLAAVAQKIHVKQEHLDAIEQLDLANMPPRPYAIGFVKSYAEFLEADPAQIVAKFKDQISASTKAAPIVSAAAAPSETMAEGETHDMSLPAVLAVVVFFIWCAAQLMVNPNDVRLLNEQAPATIALHTKAATREAAPANADMIDVSPTVIEKVEPVYPHSCAADAQDVETVVVVFTITSQGRVSGERVGQSSSPCFEDAALNAVRRWQFEPHMVGGRATSIIDQKYSFSFSKPR